MVPWLVDIPQARTAPDDLRRQLRALDPTAEIVYFGEGLWVVGKVRWNQLVYRSCVHMLGHAFHMLNTGKARGITKPGLRKMMLALLGLQGFRPVAQYQINGEPDGRIIRDFERSRWLYLHSTANPIDEILAEHDANADAARADLTDPGRAVDAWRYAFTRSHGVTNYSNLNTPKSGRTLIKSVA